MEKPHRLRLMDTYRNLFYTPIYCAVAGGFLYAEGLDVMFGTVPDDRAPLDMLRQGEVDIIQTGISRSLMALDDGEEDAPLHIAEINQGDGFFLVGKTSNRQLAVERLGGRDGHTNRLHARAAHIADRNAAKAWR